MKFVYSLLVSLVFSVLLSELTHGLRIARRRKTMKLVFQDMFKGRRLNTDNWEHEVTLGGRRNGEFQAYTNLRGNSYVRNGALHIKPSLTNDTYGESFLYNGTWNMEEFYGVCTNSAFDGCIREGQNGLLNPILSARLHSKKGIKYGKVEVIAKMPRGDWLWPAIWMLPKNEVYGSWPQSGEIDIAELRGNRDYGELGIEYMGSTLHWGMQGLNRYEWTTTHRRTNGSLADGFHNITLIWNKNRIAVHVDGRIHWRSHVPRHGFYESGGFTGPNIWGNNRNAPFDRKFYLILNVAVGSTNGFFPDNIANSSKPWANSDPNAKESFWNESQQWLPTWQGNDAAMQVKSVNMWKLD